MKKKNRQHLVKCYRGECLGSPDTGYDPGKDSQGLQRCQRRLFNSWRKTWNQQIYSQKYCVEICKRKKNRGKTQNDVKVDNEMRNCLNEILNENCLLTLTQLNQELRLRLPRKPRTCDFTMARPLEGMLLRIKLARPVPVDQKPSWGHLEKTGLCQLIHWAMLWWTTLLSLTNVATRFGLQEVGEEHEEGNGSTDMSVVSDEEMLLSQWPFHPPMVWFSTLQSLVGWMRVDLMTSWHKQN